LSFQFRSCTPGIMKTLPGIKILTFFALIFVIALVVYAGRQDNKSSARKHAKYLVQFGWSERGALDCSDRSVKEIHDHIKQGQGPHTTDQQAKKHYKVRHYNGEGIAPDPEEGDLDGVCFTDLSSPQSAASSPMPEASPSVTPKGAKTQTAGFAAFADTKAADAFAVWVNGAKN